MLDKAKWKQYGIPRKSVFKGITLHNTNSNLNASQLFEWLSTDCKTSQGCHFLVDENETIKVMPLSYSVWHTGKGEDFGNLYTIAIEICDNGDVEKAIERANRLVKELMEQYKLTKDDIFFHNEFNERIYCPHYLLDKYGSKANYVKENL